MKVKIIQNIATVKYGMLDIKRELEVDNKLGSQLVKAGYAVEIVEVKAPVKKTVKKVTKEDDTEKGDE